MSDHKSNRPTKLHELAKLIQKSKQRAEHGEFYDYVETSHIQIELPASLLTEATQGKVGQFTARRDRPHFQGDEYHGHCDVAGGYEVSWTVSGIRRHPSKFPAQIPRDAKAAVAKVLGVSPDILEAYWVVEDDERFLLLEGRAA